MSAAVQQRRAAEGAASAPLTRVQKGRICELAAKAWKAAGMPFFSGQEGMPPEARLSRSLALETWRQEEQEHVVGKRSLRHCGQGDYCLLMEHFASLAGDFDNADYWQARAAGDDSRRAWWFLKNQIAKARPVLGDAEAYARAIAKDKFGRGRLADLPAKQLWTLAFDIRRAAIRKLHRRKASAPAAPAPVLPGSPKDGLEWRPGEGA